MKKFIVVYEVNDYPDCGGGTYYEEFASDELLDKRVSEIVLDKRNSLTVAGELKTYEYKAVEYVTKVERQ
jgi:hypothetical protein